MTNDRKDWIVTIPHHIQWSTMEQEYKEAENDSSVLLNYKISYMPKCRKGDRLFILHRKQVKGFHIIDSILEDKKGFACNTTGKDWSPGIYIQRSGKFHSIKPIKMTGFRGIKEFKYLDKDINMSYDIILSDTNRVDGDDIMDSKDETIVVGKHDEKAQDEKTKETEQNDSQTFDGITVIPWKDVGQFMGGKNGLTVVSPDAMSKFPSSAKHSIQPGMGAEDGMFDLSELENVLSAASTFEKTLAEKDAKIAELEKQLKSSADNQENQCPEGQEWDAEKNACVPMKKDEEAEEKDEKDEKSDEDKKKEEEAKAEREEEAKTGESKTVEAEKDGKEEAEHSAVDGDIKNLTFLLKKSKEDGNL